MSSIALVMLMLLAFIVIYHLFWAIVMAAFLLQSKHYDVDDAALPKAAVLLSLRGIDPSLQTCLDMLLRQDYPNYEVFIAIDSESDPAWELVRQTVQDCNATHVHCSTLTDRLPTCSLKCSGLVQLSKQIDDSFNAVVLADSDFECHSSWLRELVTPLLDPAIGATFGNRVYLPENNRLGSLVRQVWNSPCLVVMAVLGIPWGGSLGVRGTVFREGRIAEKWSRAMSDDNVVRIEVTKRDLKVKFVPSLLMANREECSLHCFWDFITRQLTWTRTYITNWWWPFVVYALFIVLAPSVAVLLAITALLTGDVVNATLFALGATLFFLGINSCWWIVEVCIRQKIRDKAQRAEPVFSSALLKIPLAMILAGTMHLVSSFVATYKRRVVWRGVTYEIRGPSDVRMLNYSPYKQRLGENASSSL